MTNYRSHAHTMNPENVYGYGDARNFDKMDAYKYDKMDTYKYDKMDTYKIDKMDCGMPDSYKYDGVDRMPLAMAYIPWQRWKNVYDLNKALEAGTIFPELHLPFCGRRGDRE